MQYKEVTRSEIEYGEVLGAPEYRSNLEQEIAQAPPPIKGDSTYVEWLSLAVDYCVPAVLRLH